MIYFIIYWVLAYGGTIFLASLFAKQPQIKMFAKKVPPWLGIVVVAYLAIWISPFVGLWYIYWVFKKFVLMRWVTWYTTKGLGRPEEMEGPPEDEPEEAVPSTEDTIGQVLEGEPPLIFTENE